VDFVFLAGNFSWRREALPMRTSKLVHSDQIKEFLELRIAI